MKNRGILTLWKSFKYSGLLRTFCKMSGDQKHALKFDILAECGVTKARASEMHLPHGLVRTPVFMPVGTQGTLKGLLPDQLEELDCQIMLANTYHLGMRPGEEIMKKAGGLHKFMNWKRCLLTDSGGFQMVSLVKLSELTEEGVKFTSPYDSKEILLTPERSIEIQNAIGADIIMQLDDVVSSTLTDRTRVEEAMHRTIRWLDRCINAHKQTHLQNLFPIVQGGLDPELRKQCVAELIKRDCPGYAIGGLSGGEEKDKFWRMVHLSCDLLPKDKPRYLMGVGYAVDLVVCCALGVDMFDCVYPTRTARFGGALTDSGQINLKNNKYKTDFGPIDESCTCSTCKNYTLAYLSMIISQETVGCHLVTIHNLHYQLNLMRRVQNSIKENTFPAFVESFMDKNYPDKNYPKWVVEALSAVNIQLKPSWENENTEAVKN